MTESSFSNSVVHVVDDDESFRRAISRLLRAMGFVVREHASAGDFLLARPEAAEGCVLLDVRMPGPSGLDLQEALVRQNANLPVIFLSAHGDIPTSVKAIKAGAVDFLTKPVEREPLLAAVQMALQRCAETRGALQQSQDLRARCETLTSREMEVFVRVVSGEPNKSIAAELGIVERTVKAHRAQLMEKMGAGSLAELVHMADRLGVARGAVR